MASASDLGVQGRKGSHQGIIAFKCPRDEVHVADDGACAHVSELVAHSLVANFELRLEQSLGISLVGKQEGAGLRGGEVAGDVVAASQDGVSCEVAVPKARVWKTFRSRPAITLSFGNEGSRLKKQTWYRQFPSGQSRLRRTLRPPDSNSFGMFAKEAEDALTSAWRILPARAMSPFPEPPCFCVSVLLIISEDESYLDRLD